MNKIKKGDTVIVTKGKDRGKQGEVIRVIINEKGNPSRIVVGGVNLVYKCVKRNPQQNIEGGINQKEAPLAVSNVALFNPFTKKADRVGIKEVDGKKCRYYKSNGEMVDV